MPSAVRLLYEEGRCLELGATYVNPSSAGMASRSRRTTQAYQSHRPRRHRPNRGNRTGAIAAPAGRTSTTASPSCWLSTSHVPATRVRHGKLSVPVYEGTCADMETRRSARRLLGRDGEHQALWRRERAAFPRLDGRVPPRLFPWIGRGMGLGLSRRRRSRRPDRPPVALT